MYGITPRAKIVICDSAPPVNMSYSPNIEFCICCASSASASRFRPGVGMKLPTR